MFSREDGCSGGAVRLLRVIGEEAAFYWFRASSPIVIPGGRRRAKRSLIAERRMRDKRGGTRVLLWEAIGWRLAEDDGKMVRRPARSGGQAPRLQVLFP